MHILLYEISHPIATKAINEKVDYATKDKQKEQEDFKQNELIPKLQDAEQGNREFFYGCRPLRPPSVFRHGNGHLKEFSSRLLQAENGIMYLAH